MDKFLKLLLVLSYLFRNGHGVLDPFSESEFCHDGEEFNSCGSACERTCRNRREWHKPCPKACYSGCFCRRGLIRAADGSCIRPNECNRSSCKQNEEFYECASGCPLTCKNYQEPIFCTENCKRGCDCKPGYVRGPRNECILPQNCPIVCSRNEVTTNCVNPCNNCFQRGRCYFEYCNKGCDCKANYYRNSTGICVPARQCDNHENICPKNEHYVSCVNLCNDCWSRGDCDQTYCQPGCDCNQGYYRNDHGICIAENECYSHGSGCGVNEEYSYCVVQCNDCETRGNCDYHCDYGCDCKRGFYRDSKGVCIHASQCSGSGVVPKDCINCDRKCRADEQFYTCIPTCRNTCKNYNDTRAYCDSDCNAGCFCKKGMVRDNYGSCVHPSECMIECGLHEAYSECGSSCPVTCSNIGKPIICTHECVKGCFCMKGYVRGPHGRCIKKESCPIECPADEEYRICGTACPSTCENQHSSQECVEKCVNGCFCKRGFVRGPDGRCIRPTSCPVVCGENEVYQGCGTPCPISCLNRTGGYSYPCPDYCVKGCFCKPGYLRGPDGSCIQPELCPEECKENEVYRECGPACQATCDNLLRAVSHSLYCSKPCTKGCFCKPGYVRGPHNKCILSQRCQDCDKNEEYKECGPSCPESCSNRTRTCPLGCVKGCFCKPGFVKGPSGGCITPSLCPTTCKQNEEYKNCGTACPNTCENKTAEQQCADVCVKGCFCKPGFVKDPDETCIRPDACGQKCGEYSEYKECGTACPLTCSNRTSTSACTLQCVKGCFCTDGYVLGADGKCILPTECPIECGEYSEYKECGTACPLACSNRTSTSACTLQCVKGCFCTDGYVLGADGKCILPTECPIECEENEEYNECGTSCQVTCETSGPINCLEKCTKGCFCKIGLVRGHDGKCIIAEDCPPITCQENEEFHACGLPCEIKCGHTLAEAAAPCQQPCIRGCYCIPGFVRGPGGKCIPTSECPEVINPGIKVTESRHPSTLTQFTTVSSRTTSTQFNTKKPISTTINVATSSASDTTTKLISITGATLQAIDTSSRVVITTISQVGAETSPASTVSPTVQTVTSSPKTTITVETTKAADKSLEIKLETKTAFMTVKEEKEATSESVTESSITASEISEKEHESLTTIPSSSIESETFTEVFKQSSTQAPAVEITTKSPINTSQNHAETTYITPTTSSFITVKKEKEEITESVTDSSITASKITEKEHKSLTTIPSSSTEIETFTEGFKQSSTEAAAVEITTKSPINTSQNHAETTHITPTTSSLIGTETLSSSTVHREGTPKSSTTTDSFSDYTLDDLEYDNNYE